MRQFLLSADYHLRLTNSCGVIVNGQNSRLTDELKILSGMVNDAIIRKIDGFIILGDIFDKINPSEKLRKIFLRTVILPLLKEKITVFILMGNHDTNFEVVSFETEAELANVLSEGSIVFITEPQIIDFGDCSIYFVPFGFPIPKDNEGCQILLGHHGIKGKETGVGVIQRKGAEEIEENDFKQFKIAWFGHYHKPQDNYIGSPIKWDFGERLDEKRYILLEADNGEFQTTFIPIEDRRFIQLEFTEKDQITEKDVEGIKDSVIKLVFRGSSLWIKSLNTLEIKKNYEKAGAHKVLTHPIVEDVERISLIKIEEADSHDVILKKYIDKQEISENLKQLGLDIFRNVQQS